MHNPSFVDQYFDELPPLVLAEAEYTAWRAGRIAPDWCAALPNVFDDDDLRLARKRWSHGRHYFEWAAARHLHAQNGWYVLVAKYEFRNHKRKRAIVERMLTPAVLEVVRGRTPGRAQAPDLLVYAPDESDFYFCEVKGPGDTLRDAQLQKFARLAALTRKRVRILRCKLQAPLVAPTV